MVTFQTDRHAFFAGRTRSGKTTLTLSFLNTFPRVVIHDQKGEMTAYAAQNHYYVTHTTQDLAMLLDKGAARVIFQPAAGDESADGFDEFCHVIFDTWNITLVIDEAASYCPTGNVPKWASALMRLGNGMGIGVISLTQRPRDVANVLLSESVIIVAFRLQLKTDRTKIIETIGPTIEGMSLGEYRNMIGRNVDAKLSSESTVLVDTVLRTLPKYHFLLFDSEEETIHVCDPIDVR